MRCEHPSTVLTVKTCSDGTQRYVRQCRVCAQTVGVAIKKVVALQEDPSPVPFDEERRRAYWDQWREEAEERRRVRERLVSLQEVEYRRYLQTPAWRERRSLVHKRAGGLCEGCRKRRATETHHLTYAHVGQEFLWELVAVCAVCHERISRSENG